MWEVVLWERMKIVKKEKCFVIMPIGELDTYPQDHFSRFMRIYYVQR